VAFSQVPSGYYPSYPTAPGYGYYQPYAGNAAYGYGYGGVVPYAVTYEASPAKPATAVSEPVKAQAQAQPMPQVKGAAEPLRMPKETGKAATPQGQGATGTTPPPQNVSQGEPVGDAPGWGDRFSSFDLHPHAWVSADYMRWFLRRQTLPIPLITTGDPTMTTNPGALGQPGTQILFGGALPERSYNGYQAAVGTWLDESQCWGFEASGFWLPKNTSTALTAADTGAGIPALYIPVFRTDLNQEGRVVVADPVSPAFPPGPVTGVVALPVTTQFWGLELNGIAGSLCKGSCARLDLLVGVRYLDLRESMELDVTSSALNQAVTAQLFDRFSTSNRFYGGQVGAHGSVAWSILELDVTGKVAVGCTHESSVINGATTLIGAGATVPPGAAAIFGPGINVPAGPGTFAGGIFSTPANIRRLANDVLSAVPQVQAKVGVRVLDSVKVFAAYDFLYMSDVVRPASQVNRNVNFTELLGGPNLGPPGSTPGLTTSTFWAQGITLGMEISF
jgi:hypothetical protein